jgi:hypothetical protein
MWFRLLLAPQPRRPLNVPAVLEAFEKAICSETSHFPDEDVSFWFDPTTCPDSSIRPDLTLSLDVDQRGFPEGSNQPVRSCLYPLYFCFSLICLEGGGHDAIWAAS